MTLDLCTFCSDNVSEMFLPLEFPISITNDSPSLALFPCRPVSGVAAAEGVAAGLQPGPGRAESGPPAPARRRQDPAGREVPAARQPDHGVPGEAGAAG